MRMYGKRMGGRIKERLRATQAETRDAVIWDILEDERITRVKIQNSDELIYAHYPRNWSKTPHWLKVGNAVRVMFRAGVRGYVELFGDGRAVPTSMIGGTALPSIPYSSDAVLSGMEVTEAAPASMQVNINSGFYRINDTVYSLGGLEQSGLIMDDPPPMGMETDGTITMGEIVGYFDLQDAHATAFRYDIIVVGTNQVLDYIVGTPAATDPQFPETPADHVIVGWILILPGMTEVTQKWIDFTWTEQVFSYIFLTYEFDYNYHYIDGGNITDEDTPALQFTVCNYSDEMAVSTCAMANKWEDEIPKLKMIGTAHDQYGLEYSFPDATVWKLQEYASPEMPLAGRTPGVAINKGYICMLWNSALGEPALTAIWPYDTLDGANLIWTRNMPAGSSGTYFTWTWPTYEIRGEGGGYLGDADDCDFSPMFRMWIDGYDFQVGVALTLFDWCWDWKPPGLLYGFQNNEECPQRLTLHCKCPDSSRMIRYNPWGEGREDE